MPEEKDIMTKAQRDAVCKAYELLFVAVEPAFPVLLNLPVAQLALDQHRFHVP